MVTDIVGEKRTDLTYPILGKEVVIVSMFRDNIKYQRAFESSADNKRGKQMLKGVFTGRELNAFVGRKVITTSLDTKENVLKTNKLTGIT